MDALVSLQSVCLISFMKYAIIKYYISYVYLWINVKCRDEDHAVVYKYTYWKLDY